MKRKGIHEGRSLVLSLVLILLIISCAQRQVEKTPGAASREAKASEAAKPEGTEPAVQPPGGEEGKIAEASIIETRRRDQERENEKNLRAEIQAFETEPIYFDFDRSDLTPLAQAVLKKKAQWLLAHPQVSVRIEGHSDERGSNGYNLALGEKRATSAAKFLISLGIPPERILTVSYGEEKPAVEGQIEAAWAKNRRNEFGLIQK